MVHSANCMEVVQKENANGMGQIRTSESALEHWTFSLSLLPACSGRLTGSTPRCTAASVTCCSCEPAQLPLSLPGFASPASAGAGAPS
jgi:hypothetical protein